MKGLLALVLGGLGLGAVVRRRRRAEPDLEASPADELRARLAEARSMPDAEPAVAEPAVAEPEPVAAERDTEAPYDLNARRRDVHERTRSAIDELS